MPTAASDETTFDVGVIGAGTAGLAAAKAAHGEGARVALIEHGPLGTFCARLGCMPSKALLQSSFALARTRRLDALGVMIEGAPRLDWPAVRAREQALVSDFAGQVIRSTETSTAFTLLRGDATFVDDTTLAVDGRPITAKRWVVATGSLPVKPPIPGLDEVAPLVLTSDDIFSLDAIPASVAVLGTGAIAVELGQFLARAGARVHLVGNDDKVAGLPPGPLQDSLVRPLSRELTLQLSNHVTRVRREESHVVVTLEEGAELRVDRLLLAVGRRPNLDSLDLARVGVRMENGRPVHDEFLRTTNPAIFVAGDAAGPPALLHTSTLQGRTAGHNAVRGDDLRRPPIEPLLRIVFSDPIVASVGQDPEDARAAGCATVTGSRPWSDQGKAKVLGETEGEAQIVVDRATRKLLGCQIVGPHADLLIHLASYAMHFGATVDDLLVLHHYHPTLAEMLPSLAQRAITALEGVDCTRGAIAAVAQMQ